VNAVLAKALAKDPDARFQRIGEFVAALRMSLLAPAPPVTSASPSNRASAPDTEKSAPAPVSRDTLPTGTLPPEAVRRPAVRVVDLGKLRRRIHAAGMLLAAALASVAATVVVLAPCDQHGAPAPGAVLQAQTQTQAPASAPPGRQTPEAGLTARIIPHATPDSDPPPRSPASRQHPAPAPIPARGVVSTFPPAARKSCQEDGWYPCGDF
jgi:eukaryotic-like serine/threonine-protein kinase